MTLAFEPPLAPMLSKARDEIPRGDGWRYEPKWDGFRAIVFKGGDDVHIGSRGKKPMQRYFPELLPALREALPRSCVVDGEIVLAQDGRLRFDALQMRIHPAASRVEMLSGEIPVTFVGFDLLALGKKDLRTRPLRERWEALEPLLPEGSWDDILGPAPRVLRTPHTADPEAAEAWMRDLEPLGLDGVIAKTEDLTYQPGKRAMIKVKRRRTADCVVGGYRVSKGGDGVGSLLLGLYDEGGHLVHVGFTSSFRAKERRELLAMLEPYRGDSGFGEHTGPGGPSRWRSEETEWMPLRPELVCEVAYDHVTWPRFRHGTTFLRWREDKPPEECTLDQLGEPPERMALP